MLDHVNEISKDNYTCKYYDHSNIDRLVKSHHESALKVIHLNCSSIVKHGLDLVGYLAHLQVNFDIVMLTETRQTTTGIIKSFFPNYDIYLENPVTPKGGACILGAKNKFKNVQLITDNTFNLKNQCKCRNCEIDNVWVSLEIETKQ